MPPGYIQHPSTFRNAATWITFILPYIDQQPLYNALDFNVGFGTSGNNPLLDTTVLTAMLCPSDVEVEPRLGFLQRGNYAGNDGIGPQLWVADDTTSRGPEGVFSLNSSFRMRDFLDGSSNTAMIAELIKVPGDDLRGANSTEGSLYNHNWTPNTSVPDEVRSGECVSIDRAPCIAGYSSYDDKKVILSARSIHEGGVQLLLGDGAVRFVSENINLTTWQRLGTPQDGEVLGEF